MRALRIALTLSALSLAAVIAEPVHGAGPQAPSPKPQAPGPQPLVFRAGVELVSVDVTALDSNGRQVTDLTAPDFQVEVNGDQRKVVSAEYVRSVDPLRVIGAPRQVAPAPDETFFSSNTKGAPLGRLVLLLVDQGNIRTGTARAAMNSAKKFVDTLTPEDRVAVVAVPGPGELVDFTTDHDKVREALLRIVGSGEPVKFRFNLSVTEALAVYLRSDPQLAVEVIMRECGRLAPAEAERCERDVEQDAGQVVSEVQQRTQASVNGMRAVLQGLGGVEGPKSVILISEGLIFESLGGETDELASVAADSRATIDILLLDVPRFDVSQSVRPNTPREDRDLQTSGLELLAGAARGSLYRINTSAEYAFDRILRAIDGFYLLGVESQAADRNGRRHRISVKTARRGVTIRSRRSFLTSVSAKATTPVDAVSRALKSLLPINDLPLKVATWTYKEPGSSQVRVLIAAEAERLAEQPLDYTAGMVMVNKEGRGYAPAVGLRTLTEKAGDPGTAVLSGSMAVDPGSYRLILSMADSEGRVGSVSRLVTAWQMDGPALAMGDLILGTYTPGEQNALAPAIEPAVTGQMAALVEIYGQAPQLTGLDAVLDILPNEDAPPLATIPMRLAPGPSPEILAGNAQFSTTALPPGRYLARSTIRQGGKTQGHMTRPFRILGESPSLSVGVAAAPAGGAIPAEMAMVLLRGLSNFDRKEWLTAAALTATFAVADARGAGSKAAIKQARGGDLGAAAMTALGDGDQALAAFLKGLESYQLSQLEKAAVQFQSAVQIAPSFTPARLYLGAALADANRHKEAAGLIESAATAPPNTAAARLAGEEWIKAGQPELAITSLELAMRPPGVDAHTRKLMGIAYVLGGRPADAVAVLTPYLETNPADQAAQLAAIFGAYMRHLNAPQPATLAADQANVAKWSKAYTASKGAMQPLVAAWVKHVQSLK